MGKQNKQGRRNFNQTRDQNAMRSGRNDIELGSEYTEGNADYQSQKKSGRQVNKK